MTATHPMTPEECKEAVRLAERFSRERSSTTSSERMLADLFARAILCSQTEIKTLTEKLRQADDVIAFHVRAAGKIRAVALEEAALKVRHDCTMCEGSGHASPDIGEDGEDHECEYCGRPMAAIRALASTEGE